MAKRAWTVTVKPSGPSQHPVLTGADPAEHPRSDGIGRQGGIELAVKIIPFTMQNYVAVMDYVNFNLYYTLSVIGFHEWN
ncbi:hypothetical protein WISP_118423 [Willisornis vidua]|uniref:Uncharacterized protein n=1 Tax=Willisornis vidua TaxID=1566151 RepID=A0ABQ9CTA1_9PASS|nr:hypothetical protein WISP_118423 [Willisornis vidua]